MLRFMLADLRRHWGGALVMAALVALAVALGIGVTLQERALRLGSARAAEKFDLVIGAPGSETQLVLSTVFLQAAALPLVDGDVLARLQDDPRVDWAAPVGFGDFHRGHPVIGTTTRLIAETSQGLAEGNLFAGLDEAVIGAQVALDLGDEITPSHGLLEQGGHEHDAARYRVAGRLKPTGTAWDRAILVPIRAVWDLHGMAGGEAQAGAGGHDHPHSPLDEEFHPGETPALPAILVKPASIGDAYKLRQEYRTAPDTLAVFPAEVLTGIYALLGDARQVLSVVAIGVQVLVAAALLLVTVIHIGQRRQQIAALRAFGAPRGAVFALVWGEMLIVIAAGIGLGFAGGWLGAQQMSALISARQGFALPIEWSRAEAVTLGLLLVIAALLSTLPAIIAYRQPPLSRLRA